MHGTKYCTAGPDTCSVTPQKLGCWRIVPSYSQGSARCYEWSKAYPERYRTRKEAAAAKKERGL
jgi:hypothetical protein